MSKIIYLVSSLDMDNKIDGVRYPKIMGNSNNIIDWLKNDLKDKNNVVIIPGNSFDYERNDSIFKILFESFNMSGININKLTIIDDRYIGDIEKRFEEANLIFLSGGYPLEQIAFFNKIRLKEILKFYNGVIIGQSSGAMNCALRVLCSPEGIDNLNDSVEWEGLGLTDINIEPHFVYDESNFDEEEKIIRRELLKLSYKGEIIALPNGSYIRIDENGNSKIFGKAFSILNGSVEQIKEDRRVVH